MIIYKIKNKLNGKIYIGQTSRTAQQRWKEHLRRVRERAKLHFYAAIALYGPDNFEVKELAAAENQEIANSIESFFHILSRFDRSQTKII